MNGTSPERLRHAVSILCPEIERRVAANDRVWNERELWRELACCVLSSQVPYDLAQAAAQRIDGEGLLLGREAPASRIEAVLSEPVSVGGRMRRYRFPRSRAVQLAATHRAVMKRTGGLQLLLRNGDGAESTRSWLVANAPGVGPKQASMFLRNVGYSYELAVLDRHVLNYMRALGLHGTGALPVGLTRYHRCEANLVDHARELGYRVGLIDWAIWIVARAARRLHLEGARA